MRRYVAASSVVRRSGSPVPLCISLQIFRSLTKIGMDARDYRSNSAMGSMQTDASALQLVLGADPALLAIVGLSLTVSLAAVGIATLIGLPLGAAVALLR